MIGRALAVALVVLGAPCAFAGSAPSGQPVFGYLDPKTDIFTPLRQSSTPAPRSDAVSSDATAAPVVRQGKLVIAGTVSIDKAVPAETTFFASVSATATDDHYSCIVSRSGSVVRTGTTGKVTITLPYVCTLGSAADTISISYQIFSSTNDYISLTQKIPLPANGATTTVAIGERA